MTVLQQACVAWVIIGPTTQNPRWCEVVRSMLGLQRYFNVETLVLDQCWANVSTPTLTFCQKPNHYLKLAEQFLQVKAFNEERGTFFVLEQIN